jgi:hypothetical protein
MPHVCLALVAAVCLNQDARVEIITSSIWTGARIEIGGVTITSIVRTDAGVFPDRRRMSRYCVNRRCIYYHAYCAVEGSGHLCRISYNERGDAFSRRLEILAPDSTQMATTFGQLWIAAPRTGWLFPLSDLGERNSAPYPPWCRPREGLGCR